jgi:hypothetical protein
MLRKTLLAGLAVGCGLAWSLPSFAIGPFFSAEPSTTPGQPFSAVGQTQTVSEFVDGNRIVRTNMVRYYRDGQGRIRVERDAFSRGAFSTTSTGKPNAVVIDTKVIEIEDPVTNERINLSPQAKVATVFKMPQGVKPAQAGPAMQLEMTGTFGLLGFGIGIGAQGGNGASSVETTSLGQKLVNGVMATGTRTVRTIPAGVVGNEKPISRTLEEWKSTGLGLPVQIIEQSSIGETLTYNLQDVQEVEPDPSLFTVPANYTRQDINMHGPTSQTATFTAVKESPEAVPPDSSGERHSTKTCSAEKSAGSGRCP